MLVRIVLLFLIFIVAMAMVQKALRPGGKLGDGRPKTTIDRLRCPTCKRINLNATPTPCTRPDCRYRP